MGKIKDWTKLGEYNYSQDSNKNINVYIARNNDVMLNNSKTQTFSVISKNKTLKEANKSLKDFMRNYGNTQIHNFSKVIEKANEEIKVGNNQIYLENGSWIIEVREYVENGVPMYSVWDSVKDKETAMKIAKTLTPENAYKKHNWYLDNKKEIFK